MIFFNEKEAWLKRGLKFRLRKLKRLEFLKFLNKIPFLQNLSSNYATLRKLAV